MVFLVPLLWEGGFKILNPSIVTGTPFQLKHVTCIPRRVPSLLPLWTSGGCPWQVGRRAALPCVAFGWGAHSAFPSCEMALICSLLELMFGVCFFRVDTAGESCFLHRLRLSRHPSLVVILLSLCWALARQLVWVAWLFVILLSLCFDKKGDQAKVVFLPLPWQWGRLLSLTRTSYKNIKGRIPCPHRFNSN